MIEIQDVKIQQHIVVSEHYQIMLHCGIQRHQVIIVQVTHIVRHRQLQHVDFIVIQIIHGIHQQVSV